MAVAKSRKSRSSSGHKSAHRRKLDKMQISSEQTTGEFHLRHHVSKLGYYKGKQVLNQASSEEE